MGGRPTVRVCLPSGSNFGWGVAGGYIADGLRQRAEIGAIDEPRWPLLMAVAGHTFAPARAFPRGCRDVGFAFIENPSLAKPHARACNDHYDILVCGSRWMARQMDALGIKRTTVVWQGVDYGAFAPGKAAPTGERFIVFSGGKFEYRKGQDLVIAAMKRFMRRHQDVYLHASWLNLWPQTMKSMARSPYIEYSHGAQDWKAQVLDTLRANDIPLDRVVLVDDTPHTVMAEVYRRAHVGVFPNRAEAGTNMVLCEAIACGVPCIVSAGTGHLDILDEVCPLTGELDFMELRSGGQSGPDDWWEPSGGVEELVDRLEWAYRERETLRLGGLLAAERIRAMLGWERCCDELLRVLASGSA